MVAIAECLFFGLKQFVLLLGLFNFFVYLAICFEMPSTYFFFLYCYRLDFFSWDDYIYERFKNKRRKLSVELCHCLVWWYIVRCKPSV